MSNLVPASVTTVKRLEKFLGKCKEACKSKAQFARSFNVNDYHITAQGLSKNHKRLGLNHEKIAGIILHGRLNIQNSNDNHRLEIAVEGLIRDFEWVDPMKLVQMKEALVQARVVIREAKPKNFIVTAYILDVIEQHDLPEVEIEIW